MARVRLTKRGIETAKADPVRDVFLWDAQVAGLAVRIKPSGVRSFLIQWRDENRRTRRLSLGRFGPVTLERARDKALSELGKIADGENPADQRQQKREAQAPLTFADAASRYLDEAMGHLADTTREDRQGMLRLGDPETGRDASPIVKRFGPMPLADISRRDLLEWWTLQVEASSGVTRKTAKNRLDAIAAVFAYAQDLELIESSPVEALRSVLRRRSRTKAGRSDSDHAERICPIEQPEDLEALLEKSAARPWINPEDGRASDYNAGHLLTLLQLDAGLRLGEALGLRWADITFGADASDLSRCLTIRNTRARGRFDGSTKSGRARRVDLPQRLRSALLERFLAAGRPPAFHLVLPGADAANYRKRHFVPACEAAKIGARRPKDLRDTFASQLLTAGVQLGYVSKQLGHADVGVTARHYSRWCSDVYREPMRIESGEVPADFLARLPKQKQGSARRAHGELAAI